MPAQENVSLRRRLLAWGLLLSFIAAGAWFQKANTHPAIILTASILFWSLLTLLVVRGIAFLVLDPLLRSRKAATPGFARDLLLFVLYFLAAGFILRYAAGVSPGQILGTGALAAAVVGLSLQETLGNLFAGLAMHLDPAFHVGDWVEVSGTLRGAPGRETYIGEVRKVTWRSVHLITEDGDTEVVPNRAISQAIVTNLYAPKGLHRRTARLLLEPDPELHVAMARLTTALAGIPHPQDHPPEVLIKGFEHGAVLEMRWWSLGFQEGRHGLYQASLLANSVLPREGFALVGPDGPFFPEAAETSLDSTILARMLAELGLPQDWARELVGRVHRRRLIPGEGVIREGDPGGSLFSVLSGRLQVVKVAIRDEPYHGFHWDVTAELLPGSWFGEASLLTGAPRNATVIAAVPSELLEVPKDAFESVLRHEPHVIERLVDLMESRLKEATPAHPEQRARRREMWLQQIRGWFGL